MINNLKGKTVLVTGGTGSIGSEIVKQVLNCEVDKVIVFSRDEIKQFLFQNSINDSRLNFVIGDISNYRSIERVFDKFNIDVIYHAAAMKHVVVCEKFPIESIKTNVIGTQNLVDLAVKYNIQRMITISTDKSAGPVNVMGASKFIAEIITLNANYSCVRFGNVANSRGSVIPVFIENLVKTKQLKISNPNATRFVIRISDAVGLVLKATKYAKGGDIFILKMNAFKLGDLLDVVTERIAPMLGVKENVNINKLGLVHGEKLHEDLINSTEINRLYELDDMYVVLKDNENISKYENLKKSNLQYYASNNVNLLSKDEIEDLACEYIEVAYKINGFSSKSVKEGL